MTGKHASDCASQYFEASGESPELKRMPCNCGTDSEKVKRSTTKKVPPDNLVHIALAYLDPSVIISPDGRSVQVTLEAVAKLVTNPPPMIKAHMTREGN